ncbi:Ras-related protein Rab-33B [Eumeta japonica]|uniref:Ras-related protein Rab-33B n=1 Tax=Eumeta variegata TaxID=151549 RepID=A0A4C1XCW8_EUMVA|nr:Ras-related protein Rab-33B [Eumeta japonica]
MLRLPHPAPQFYIAEMRTAVTYRVTQSIARPGRVWWANVCVRVFVLKLTRSSTKTIDIRHEIFQNVSRAGSNLTADWMPVITAIICRIYLELQLWDTAGQERFRKSMVQHYYRNVHAVVIVYDATKPVTFNSITSWMQEIEAHGLMNAPRVLVGNKCDCGQTADRLPTTYAQRLADQYGMPLFETSALLDSECDNVESIFMTLAHKLYSKQPLRVISVEGERTSSRRGVVKLAQQKSTRPNSATDSCLCT